MRISLVVVASSAVFLAGCAGVPVSNTTQTGDGQSTILHGKVYGGQQPIAGASVYLYAANTTGYGGESVSLLNGPGFVTTGSDGSFSITSDYTCPSPSPQVYLYSVGGNPGGGANSAAGLLAGLGSCSALATNKPFVFMNEVSTVATAYAIAGFATDATHVSSSSGALGQTGIANAFSAIPNLETLQTGVALATTPGTNGTVPQSEINTLANILASCINSAGAGSTSCTTLLSNATNAYGTEPTDTASAAINIAHNPGANVASLFDLQGGSPPFVPDLPSSPVPNDFTIALNFTGGGLSDPAGVAIDSSGNVWTPNFTGNTVSEFNFAGVALSGSGFTGGGLNNPRQIAIDGSGNAWVTNLSGFYLSEFNSSGTPVSSTGYMGSLNAAYGVAIDGNADVWVANVNSNSLSEFNSAGVSQTGLSGYLGGGLNAPYGIAIDGVNRVWVSNYYDILSEFNNSGITLNSSGYGGGGLDEPYGIAVDGSGNVWMANQKNNSLSMFSSNGVAQSGSGFTGGGLSNPIAIAIDGAGNVWAANNGATSISEFNSAGIALSGTNGYEGGALNTPNGIAVDGSGNVWVTNGVTAGASISEFVGAATPVVTPMAANLQSSYGGHAVNPPFYNSLALPAPNPATLSSGAVSQTYYGWIIATGGNGSYSWTVNGTAVPTNGSPVSIGDGLSVSSNGGSALSVTGTPTSATMAGSPLSFTAQVTSASVVAGADTYTIAVNAGGGQINGQINLSTGCNNSTTPNFTVTLTNTLTGRTIQTITNTSGQFGFTGVPTGTYSISPSLPSATTSVFYPASYPAVAVTSSTNLSGENFSANVGYTVSGTASYSGSQANGRVYLTLNNNTCGGNYGNPGTSVAYPFSPSGAFSIRGVPPGNYTLEAFMDPAGLGEGAQNANDPMGSSSSFTVSTANVTGQNVALSDPAYATPPSNPVIQGISPSAGGVVIGYQPVTNGNGIEAANAYEVEWSTSPALNGSGGSFTTVTGSIFFKANGEGSNVWILTNTVFGNSSLTPSGTGFTSGDTYYFQARAYNTLAGTEHPSGWTTYGGSTPTGVTIGTPACPGGNTCYSISGAVTIPSGLTVSSGAPLYVGVYNQSNGEVYPVEIASPTTGSGSPNDFTIDNVPSGDNYFLFYILDQNNNGEIDAGDATNTRNSNSAGLSVTTTLTGQDLTVATTNSNTLVNTSYYTSNCNGCTPSYNVGLQVREGNKLPVAVTLRATSANPAYLMFPIDIGLCATCGNTEFAYNVNLPGGTPNVGDSFDFAVTYSDGTVETGTTVNGAVTPFGSTGAIVGANDVATNLQTTAGTTPNFTWTFPSNPSNYAYSFFLDQNSNCTGNCTIWQIPGQNSNSNGFTYSETETGGTTGEIVWGDDPTGGGSTPSGSLNPSDNYNWQITVQDNNGNQAGSSASDNTP